jgi:Flp pilus assembly protein TadB
MTGTLGNPAVATAELGGSLIVSLLALIAPVVTALAIIVLLWLAIRWVRGLSRERRPTKPQSD